MIKKVRVENADIGRMDILVERWKTGKDGAEDTLENAVILFHPTDMLEVYVGEGYYLRVKERT